ncbi:Rrf2 family transcriptional regulator [Sulfitobacter sp. M57]|uniref:RrF2 family transcriptional regulator n=1 Tax=unclassified Sulfitobacter TaxID=196795 RepID=UPI0023E315D4|nr:MULTISPECIES: Rrf2 family transcriptional regulator [unclassified Sulfitobacter]MDF3414463.1 Rrf2 family transcriptional regulator [Sulfitobacter sp. KE5]MDF3421944.1 Rrf2 family transcriptional regulator [Sulfitobacter sp. KE43]MDF3433009.1 Rrf2 family transcriptional regulator [Sulfitobacter sp. KE42]MDF3458649.1 Rrf2 family transcriptional regulator [Sulfitobacter sp. S74]MDF3462549.1 Rrf2 family transcriptional regulator [Sulfitobacter sp. Ks18]
MQLDKFSDYALRVMMVLAVRAPERVSAREIADTFAISENHVAKIATVLVREGYVLSQRGRAGGLCLAHPAAEISVGAVLRQIKAPPPVAECFAAGTSCRILPACGLRSPLKDAQEAFFTVLDGYSLADITVQQGALAGLLAAAS